MKIRVASRYILSLVLTLALVVGTLLVPGTVFSVSPTITSTVTSEPVGKTIPLTASVAFTGGELADIQNIKLKIVGPLKTGGATDPGRTQTLNFDLPPSGAVDTGANTQKGKVTGTATQVSLTPVAGTGYGYQAATGYSSGQEPKINYSLKWEPPALLDPVPQGVDAYPASQFKFTLPANIANIPSGTNPQKEILGLAYDSATDSLYAQLQSFSGNQVVLKLNATTGAQTGIFEVPNSGCGTTSGGLEFFGGSLFIVNNCASPRTIIKTDAGGNVQATLSTNNFAILGGLANDGTNLVAGEASNNTLFKIDPSNGSQVGNAIFVSSTFQIGNQFISLCCGFKGLAYQDAKLFGFISDKLVKMSTSGTVEDVKPTGFVQNTLFNVGGLANAGQGFWVANNNEFVNLLTQAKIYKTAFEAISPDPTLAGEYNASLLVATNPTTESSAVTFTLTKLSTLTLTITQPTANQAFTDEGITVTGTTNDPTASINIGGKVGKSTLLDDDVETNVLTNSTASLNKWEKTGIWHRSQRTKTLAQAQQGGSGGGAGFPGGFFGFGFDPDAPSAFSGTHVYAYQDAATKNFGASGGFGISKGELALKNSISLGADAKLTFRTWWDTESGNFYDRKLVQFKEDNTSNWKTIAQIADPFSVSQGCINNGEDNQVQQGCTVVGSQQGNFVFGGDLGWALVEINLTQTGSNLNLANKTGKFRFRFNSQDGIANFGKGWFVDDIKIEGEGVAGGATATVNKETLAWTGSFTATEGTNELTVSAQSGYIEGSSGQASSTVTFSVDKQAPIITMAAFSSVFTNSDNVTAGGTFTELSPDVLEMFVNDVLVLTDKALTGPTGTYSKSVPLAEGLNTIKAKLTDKAARTATATRTITKDTLKPTLTNLGTKYPLGRISARAGDLVIFDVNASDPATTDVSNSSGVDKVEFQIPSGQSAGTFIPFLTAGAGSGQIPEAVKNQWGATGAFIFPFTISSAAAPGTQSFNVKVTDKAGNSETFAVTAVVVPALEAINIAMMPDWNLISLPLTPDAAATSTKTQARVIYEANSTAFKDALTQIWYYDASIVDPNARWKVFNANSALPSDLTELKPGRGYWFKMDTTKFSLSAPLPGFTAQTPAPINFSYAGKLLPAGAQQIPPTYPVVKGWNLVGLHSENVKKVSQSLRSVSVPTVKWGSLLTFNNFIKFEKDKPPQIVLGTYAGLDEESDMEPGKGYWLFMVEDGTIAPTN